MPHSGRSRKANHSRRGTLLTAIGLIAILMASIIPMTVPPSAQASAQQAIVLEYNAVDGLTLVLEDPTNLRLTATANGNTTFLDIPDALGRVAVGIFTDFHGGGLDLSPLPSSGTIGPVTVEIGPQPGGTASLKQLGTISAFSDSRWDNRLRNSQGQMTKVVSLGDLGLESLQGAFRDTQNLEVSASLPSTVTSLAGVGYQAKGNFRGVADWDTSRVISLENAFFDTDGFNEDISGWDTSNVTTLRGAFWGAGAFNQDISGWDTSSVDSMSGLFRNASAFNQNISGWNTSQVSTMQRLFSGASVFNQNLGSWNVESVTTMASMLNSSGMSNANYAATLDGWATQDVETGITLSASGLVADTCSRGLLAKSTADGGKGWTISDSSNPPTSCGTATVTWGAVAPADRISPFTPNATPTTTGGAITYSVVNAGATGCTVNPTTGVISYVAAGNCEVRATAAGTSSLFSGFTAVTFQLPEPLKPAVLEWAVDPTITINRPPFTPSPLPTTNDGGDITYRVVNPESSACSVDENTGEVSFTAEGPCEIEAIAAASDDALEGSLRIVFQLPEPIPAAELTWDAETNIEASRSPFLPPTLPETNGGAITYSVVDPTTSGCTVNPSTGAITFVAAGDCEIRASVEATDTTEPNFITVVFTLPTPTPEPQQRRNTRVTPPLLEPVGPALLVSPTGPGFTQPGTTTDANTNRARILGLLLPRDLIGASGASAGLGPVWAESEGAGLASTVSPANTPGLNLAGVTAEIRSASIEQDTANQTLSFRTAAGDETVSSKNVRIVQAGSLSLILYPLSEQGAVIDQPVPDEMWIEAGGTVRVIASGLQPNALVRAWIFSTPNELGVFDLDDNGELVTEFGVPSTLEPGDHTLKLVGPSPSGEIVSVWMSVFIAPAELSAVGDQPEEEISEPTNASTPVGSFSWMWILIVIALGILTFLVLWFRKKDNEVSEGAR